MTRQIIFAFGPFMFLPEKGKLLRNGAPVAVGYRGLLLLDAFLKRPGQVLTKAELIDAAWQGKTVEESNLSVQIASLRKLLGPSSPGSEWISTIPRVGYRFVGDLEERARTRTPIAEPEPVKPSLAVLPFAGIGNGREQDYFDEGVVEDIITALSRYKSFAVIARNSSFVYKGRAVDVREVAKELGVRYVLQGSVRRAGNRLRITAQLVECLTAEHLWANHFDGVTEDVFDFQDEITASVASVVEPQIQGAEIERSRRERPASIAVYDLYLRALAKHNTSRPEDHAAAYALLTEALRLEPENPVLLAHAAAALDHRITMGLRPLGTDDWEKRTDLARRGLERAGSDANVMARCGMALLHSREYDLAFATVERAVQMNPHSLYILFSAGVSNIHCGSIEDALKYLHRALKLSPGDPDQRFALTGIAHAHMILGNFAEAIRWAERSLSISGNFGATYWMLIAANAHLGRLKDANRYMTAFRAIAPGVTVASIQSGQPDKDPDRMTAILEGLRLAGLDER